MVNRKLQLLTSSRLATLRTCPRKHYYRYELGLSRVRSAEALRFGGAYHAGLEAHNRGADDATAMARATAGYEQVPQWADPVEWAVQRQTLRQLLAGHFWRYSNDDLQVVAVEQVFQTPLINPGSGHASRIFLLAGKIDAIVKLPDGRLAVLEYKTAGEDIATDSNYWLRLRCDGQISQYVLGARALGFDVSTVIYDVTRKPTIRLRKDETPQQYGQRLLGDIGQRPDCYFARREVPRLEDELAEYRLELWQQAAQLRHAQRADRWFRNVGRMTCPYCPYADLCLNCMHVKVDAPPVGYEILSDVHPELQTGGEASQGDCL
ncbi:RecB family exonuclease [Fontivita pretiosa]|uniref:RecB family exonuclease n=1 Tax=Fontivita pretiosa TaxID=2989684 RepID=UPI003D17C55A